MKGDPPSFAELVRVFARIGLLSFGGPAGQIAVMHRELVERRRWVSERRFLHALNYCMLLPGPEAQQLAAYVGWLLHGTWGGIACPSVAVTASARQRMRMALDAAPGSRWPADRSPR